MFIFFHCTDIIIFHFFFLWIYYYLMGKWGKQKKEMKLVKIHAPKITRRREELNKKKLKQIFFKFFFFFCHDNAIKTFGWLTEIMDGTFSIKEICIPETLPFPIKSVSIKIIKKNNINKVPDGKKWLDFMALLKRCCCLTTP